MIVKYVVLVPLCMNDGTEVDRLTIIGFEKQLLDNFGGFTNVGTVEGAYEMSDGTLSFARTIQYWVCAEESEYGSLRSLVADLGRKLGQESMYLESTGAKIDFVKGSER